MQQDKERKVFLHGNLGRKYGKEPISIFSHSLRDVFRGLCCMFGHKFKEEIKSGAWNISTGKRKGNIIKNENLRTQAEIDMYFSEDEIHVWPAVVGSGGVGRIIIGVVLIVIAIVIVVCFPVAFAASGYLGMIGVGLLVGIGVSLISAGVSMMMNKPPTVKSADAEKDKKPSFLYNGIVNTIEQGGCVPIVYGRHMTGSTVISSGVTVEKI